MLAETSKLLQYANIRGDLEVQAGWVGAYILQLHAWGADQALVQHLWDMYWFRIISMTSRGGYRADQTERVLIAEHQAKARMESLAGVGAMGPKAKEGEGGKA